MCKNKGRNLVIAERFLKAGAQTELADINGITSLHIAADGELFIGMALIVANANVNAKTTLGDTPLILAVQSGENEFTELLIE